jgi:hypothetical protein
MLSNGETFFQVKISTIPACQASPSLPGDTYAGGENLVTGN